MEGTEAETLAHDAVNSHMRIVLSMESLWEKHSMTTNDLKVADENLETTGERDVTIDNQNMESLGRMVTTTPSEPVVAEAIAEVLCLKTATTFNWASSITTLVEILLSRGMIEKGIKGELYTRLLCIIARDIFLDKARLITIPIRRAILN